VIKCAVYQKSFALDQESVERILKLAAMMHVLPSLLDLTSMDRFLTKEVLIRSISFNSCLEILIRIVHSEANLVRDLLKLRKAFTHVIP
jgi:hypothetical protein